jgi:2-ketoarginine methyltransferase
MTEDFELRLIDALQPVRGFVLAQVLHAAMRSELWDRLRDGATGAEKLAADLGLEPRRLTAVLGYLANEGFVVRGPDGYELSVRGADITEFAPWYRLLVGGYATTFQSIPLTLRAGAPYAERDGTAVGQGSCGISAYDAIPLARSLLRQVPRPVDHLLDLGCGDGTVLLALAADTPGAALTGVDPHPPSVDSARAAAARQGLAASFHQADGAAYVSARPPAVSGTACYLIAFTLQEILEQRGRPAVVDLVRDALRASTDAYLIVIEVDWKVNEPSVMRHGLGLAYYNPYYLIHALTEQRLESREFWRAVAEDAGGTVLAVGEVDPHVDSTGLEFGFLIGHAR